MQSEGMDEKEVDELAVWCGRGVNAQLVCVETTRSQTVTVELGRILENSGNSEFCENIK